MNYALGIYGDEVFGVFDFYRGRAWFRRETAPEVEHRSSGVNDMLKGFPGVIVRAIASPLNKISEAVLFGPFGVKYRLNCP